ncbi:odorant-binding protein 2a-like [Acomys russatus]|uniref:odorant-binding protein 2a-like n=1 Tax=Acomys russatus TaxID=60746 RepID=UPI0021E2A5EE|nr:odorant-binding protein 2a-like [Acomys russatus]
MKSLFLTVLLLGLVAVLRAQELPSDDIEDYSGLWIPKGIGHNGNLPYDMLPKKAFPMMVTSLEEGDLEATVTFWKNGECHELKIVMKKTEEPGKYTSFNGKKTVYIKKLQAEGHYIFYCECLHNGKAVSMAKLAGRHAGENPEAMKEFKEFLKTKGFSQENIFVPEMKDKCVPESD